MLTADVGPGSLLAGDSREYRLGPVLAEGGEGVVYFVDARDDVVAKLYKEWEYGRDAKLRGLIGLSTKRLRRVAAWPLSCLYDSQDRSVGFVMESLEDWQPLHSVYQIRTRLRDSPQRSWAFLVRVARNLATCVHHVHEHGMVIGDLNESNVLVGADAMVKIIDADSFQVRLEDRLYPCKVAKPELLAPELQGESLEGTERTPDQDRFSLAILIFQILVFGRHPFAGRPVADEDVSLERAIRNGWYVYSDRRDIPVLRPPHLTLDALPESIRELFERAFDPAEPVRPGGREWYLRLKELEGSLRACDINGSHVYWGGQRLCPWCGLEEKWNIILFRPAPLDPLSAADFDVEAVWRRIAALPWPVTDSVPEPIDHRSLTPARLPTWMKWSLRPMTMLGLDSAFWVLYIAIVLGRGALEADPIWKFGFLVLVAVALGGVSYLQILMRRVRKANRAIEAIGKLWKENADPELYRQALLALLVQRNSLLANHDRYEAARHARIRELHHSDLERYLRKYSIMAADVGAGNEGRGRLTVLRDRGFVTAADIDEERLRKVRDFDAKFWPRLIEWRGALEQQFWQASSYSLPPHEERAILDRIHRQDVSMRRELLGAEAKLTELAANLRTKQTELFAQAAPYEATVRRHGALLAALGPRPRKRRDALKNGT